MFGYGLRLVCVCVKALSKTLSEQLSEVISDDDRALATAGNGKVAAAGSGARKPKSPVKKGKPAGFRVALNKKGKGKGKGKNGKGKKGTKASNGKNGLKKKAKGKAKAKPKGKAKARARATPATPIAVCIL